MCGNGCYSHFQVLHLTDGCFAELHTFKKNGNCRKVDTCSVKCCHQISAARTVNERILYNIMCRKLCVLCKMHTAQIERNTSTAITDAVPSDGVQATHNSQAEDASQLKTVAPSAAGCR
jgi:hypothetical protein